ncbi:MAG: HAMP domain-containing histidine kinase, partial [Pseudorhodobacter sp.]|nr:HAMP domain-containing histidine kinase [Pseudorhodobacter sp.]
VGLRLYVAAEIAKAHGGTLAATSDDDKTVFTFRMPQD